MNNRFSHLVWLGAGTASEPTELLKTAEQVTLVEVRETACMLLQKKYAQPNICIKQQLVSTISGSELLIEYNLAEYSATAPLSGLKSLFPGIKKIGSAQINSISVNDLMMELRLNGSNNSLILDIPDSNLALLMTLQLHGQLELFNNIQVHAAIAPLYEGSASASEISSFFTQHGFLLTQCNNLDPELPWLTFESDTQGKELEKIKQKMAVQQQINDSLSKEIDLAKDLISASEHDRQTMLQELAEAKKEISAQKEIKDNLNKEIELAKSADASLHKKAILTTQELEKAKQELTTQQKIKDSQTKEFDLAKNNIATLLKEKQEIAQELEKAKQELTTQQKIKDSLTKEFDLAKNNIAALLKEKQEIAQELENNKISLADNYNKEIGKVSELLISEKNINKKNTENFETLKKDILVIMQEKTVLEKTSEKIKLDFDQLQKTTTNRKEMILKLEKENISLIEKNIKLEKKLLMLEKEMLKADAQINLIKDLMMR